MKNLFNHDIFLIDLSKVKNTMLEDLIKDNDLDDKISVDTLINFKKEGFIKLWVEKSTMEIVAYTFQNNKEILINTGYISFLKSISPITLKKAEVETKKVTTKKVDSKGTNENYTIDSILDKISTSGMESLSSKELKFLNENSGKL